MLARIRLCVFDRLVVTVGRSRAQNYSGTFIDNYISVKSHVRVIKRDDGPRKSLRNRIFSVQKSYGFVKYLRISVVPRRFKSLSTVAEKTQRRDGDVHTHTHNYSHTYAMAGVQNVCSVRNSNRFLLRHMCVPNATVCANTSYTHPLRVSMRLSRPRVCMRVDTDANDRSPDFKGREVSEIFVLINRTSLTGIVFYRVVTARRVWRVRLLLTDDRYR